MRQREKKIKKECIEEAKALCYVIEDEGVVYLGYRRSPALLQEEMDELYAYFLDLAKTEDELAAIGNTFKLMDEKATKSYVLEKKMPDGTVRRIF